GRAATARRLCAAGTCVPPAPPPPVVPPLAGCPPVPAEPLAPPEGGFTDPPDPEAPPSATPPVAATPPVPDPPWLAPPVPPLGSGSSVDEHASATIANETAAKLKPEQKARACRMKPSFRNTPEAESPHRA